MARPIPKISFHPKYKSWWGYDKKEYESLLSKGSSLINLGKTDIKSQTPDYKEIKEKGEVYKEGRLYAKSPSWMPGRWSIPLADYKWYRGIGKERSIGGDFVGYDTRKKGQKDIDRILGLFARRKQEASQRKRAPGRGATMLTSPGKSITPGY